MDGNGREWDGLEVSGSLGEQPDGAYPMVLCDGGDGEVYGGLTAPEREEIQRLVEVVIGAAYEVGRVLGAGFLEKVYERALVQELRTRGVACQSGVPVQVHYKGALVGEYFADIVVEGKLILELKCVEQLGNEHLAQCLNYLKATGLRMALLINFQHPRVHWKRVVRNF